MERALPTSGRRHMVAASIVLAVGCVWISYLHTTNHGNWAKQLIDGKALMDVDKCTTATFDRRVEEGGVAATHTSTVIVRLKVAQLSSTFHFLRYTLARSTWKSMLKLVPSSRRRVRDDDGRRCNLMMIIDRRLLLQQCLAVARWW